MILNTGLLSSLDVGHCLPPSRRLSTTFQSLVLPRYARRQHHFSLRAKQYLLLLIDPFLLFRGELVRQEIYGIPTYVAVT
jgi:hypothetical protein